MKRPAPFVLLAVLAVSVLTSLLTDSGLSVRDLLFYPTHPALAESFDAYYYLHGSLPRVVMALAGGAVLGLVGSLLQQLTRNPMTSPLTLGTSSGAWLALTAVSAFWPGLANDWLAAASLAGGLIAFGLVVLITGPRHLTGVTLVISGMVVNLLFGALATAIVLLNSAFIQNVFLWGSGDLEQNGWSNVVWFLLRAVPIALVLLTAAPRALALLSLGDAGARARGLPVVPVFAAFTTLGIAASTLFVTAAGVINFTGLIAPNLVRLLGFRNPRSELMASAAAGAVLLAATDALAVQLSLLTNNIVPCGVVSAVIGTPVFIWFVRKQRSGEAEAADNRADRMTSGRRGWTPAVPALLIAALAVIAVITLWAVRGEAGWSLASPDVLSLRWPRLVTAIFAGAGFAAAGVVLQRLVHNPLASPDILGVSSGASFAIVLGVLFLGVGTGASAALCALSGSLLIIALLIGFARSAHFAPSSVILLGIAVSACLDSATTLVLSRGTMDNYFLLQWLSGTTYRTTPATAGLLTVAVTGLTLAALAVSRSLTLLSVGQHFAAGRGLRLAPAAAGLLFLCALLCAAATTAMGPVAFVGLVAPHMAFLSGARTVKSQLVTAALVGALLVATADWLGRELIAPAQIPAGTLASVLGAGYFLALLIAARLRGR